ncbi:hypothetical protein M422DRAFT_251263 [Sphaerobolus stellatus SS14]|uniref:Uncharacterized protein n=1 Tax=Sphaerobolus stellatus (strain SS14) TaxID=990650 RepID=A0A0C9VDE4_SPHS4|nr:hypothetical protein M422DRAFT_251263 [Sphaerobolus stellatus SS14]
MAASSSSNTAFKQLKEICVPLLQHTLLTPQAIPATSSLLTDLYNLLSTLRAASNASLTPGTLDYVFFPIVQLIKRNPLATIPDVIIEKLMLVLGVLFEEWWWACEIDVWEQMVMLCAAVFCGIDTLPARGPGIDDVKGKRRERTVEARRATLSCLIAMLKRQQGDVMSPKGRTPSMASHRYTQLHTRAQLPKLLPILGQTLTSLLETAQSSSPTLQDSSLELIKILLEDYFSDAFIPSVLPGVVSTMIKVALGKGKGGWVRSELIKRALEIIGIIVVRGVGDDICEREGALNVVTTLEDLTNFQTDLTKSALQQDESKPQAPYTTRRTPSFVSSTASQLLLALNTLSPLLTHPHPTALLSLSYFASLILSQATQTLSDATPILLRVLLTLSTKSQFPDVAVHAQSELVRLLSPSPEHNKPSASHTLLHTLSKLTSDNLSSLPRLLSTSTRIGAAGAGLNDTQIQTLSSQVIAACSLAFSIPHIRTSFATLLGPTGGIEKWGWNILSVLHLAPPVSHVSVGIKSIEVLLEAPLGEGSERGMFPEIGIKGIESRETKTSVEEMFRALGRAADEEGLWAVEWFVGVGVAASSSKRKGGRWARWEERMRRVAALWVGARILEGLGGVKLGEMIKEERKAKSKRMKKVAKWVAKSVAGFWERPVGTDDEEEYEREDEKDGQSMELDTFEDANRLPTEYIKGFDPLVTTFDLSISQPQPRPIPIDTSSNPQPIDFSSLETLRTLLSLHLLTLTSTLLTVSFRPLLLYTLYPLLHSLTSSNTTINTTALSALSSLTHSLSYATPSNLLLANFDYALDATSKRLAHRRNLDVEAFGVMRVLVRLVGRDVVARAGDVIEGVFERLEEFHGYGDIVEGVFGVVGEVVGVLKEEGDMEMEEDEVVEVVEEKVDHVRRFTEWYKKRSERIDEEEEDYGKAPKTDWGTLSPKGKEQDEEAGTSMDTSPSPDAQIDEHPPPLPPQQDQEPKLTPSQELTAQIITHSTPFLTHGNPVVRARILSLIEDAALTLSPSHPSDSSDTTASALLPTIHKAWPYILNRLSDASPFVITAAASLIASLSSTHGDFLSPRLTKDIWLRFKTLLSKLEESDKQSALAKQTTKSGVLAVGTESIYTNSTRLYCGILKTLKNAVKGGGLERWDVKWDVCVRCRKFLGSGTNEEVRKDARALFRAMKAVDEDLVWVALMGSLGRDLFAEGNVEEREGWRSVRWLGEESEKWDLEGGVKSVFGIPEVKVVDSEDQEMQP